MLTSIKLHGKFANRNGFGYFQLGFTSVDPHMTQCAALYGRRVRAKRRENIVVLTLDNKGDAR